MIIFGDAFSSRCWHRNGSRMIELHEEWELGPLRGLISHVLTSSHASVAFAANFTKGLLGNGVFNMNTGRKLWSFLCHFSTVLRKGKDDTYTTWSGSIRIVLVLLLLSLKGWAWLLKRLQLFWRLWSCLLVAAENSLLVGWIKIFWVRNPSQYSVLSHFYYNFGIYFYVLMLYNFLLQQLCYM